MLRGSSHQNADNAAQDAVRSSADDLAGDGVARTFGETCIVVLIQDAGADTSDGGDDATMDGVSKVFRGGQRAESKETTY